MLHIFLLILAHQPYSQQFKCFLHAQPAAFMLVTYTVKLIWLIYLCHLLSVSFL